MRIYNRTDIDSLRLECTECKTTRSMVQVFSDNALSEFPCTCKHPHFKDPYARVQYGCHDKMRARLRSASGVYFPITKAALLIPPWSKKVVNCIQKNYSILKNVEEDKLVFTITQWIETDRLFVSWNGNAMFVHQPYKWFQHFCKVNNVRFCDLHSLRHFHASILIFAGVDPVTVSGDLGHSAVSTTTSTYVHLFQEAQARTSEIITEALDFSKKKKNLSLFLRNPRFYKVPDKLCPIMSKQCPEAKIK